MPDTENSISDVQVVDVPGDSRFELMLGTERVGLADYSVVGDVMIMPHVETDPAHRGHPMGGR